MATFAQYLAQLKDNGVKAKFFDDNFSNDKFFNMMQYGEDADVTGAGRLSVTVEGFEADNTVEDAAAWGSELDARNVYTKPYVYYLAKFGNTYSVDGGLPDTVFDRTAIRLASVVVQRAKSSFIHNFFFGDGSVGAGTGNEPVGIKKIVETYSNIADAFDSLAGATLTEAIALEFLVAYNEAVAKLNVTPNCIIASRTLAATLKSISALINRSTLPITIGSVTYDTFLGLPIVEVGDVELPAFVATAAETYLDLGDTYQFMFIARVDLNDGLYLAGPSGNNFISVQLADKVNTAGASMATGHAKIVSCPVLNINKCVALLPIKTINV